MDQRRNEGERMKKKFGFHIVKKKQDSMEEIVDDIIEELQDKQDLMREMELKIKTRRYHFLKRIVIGVALIVTLVAGTGVFLKYQTYQNITVESIYKIEEANNSNYIEYAGGILKYSRDGVVYLDKGGEEIWNQPCQMKNPIVEVCKGTVAVGDRGGTSILVFQKDGLKGEIKTTSPKQKVVVSEQGIVGTVLKGESVPQIICYDAKGNVLVKQNTSLANTGYPFDIAISNNGEALLVSYLSTKGSESVTKVICYNFGETGDEKKDHQIFEKEYENEVIPTVAFLDENSSVLIGNDILVFHNGLDHLEEIKKIKVKKEIKSVSYDKNKVALILKNSGETGYELRVYNTKGKQILSKDFEGEYGNIKMTGDQVVLYDGNKCMIFNFSGVCKFEGKMEANILEIFRMTGLNKYMVISAEGLQEVHLVK